MQHIQNNLFQTGCRLLLQVFRFANILLPNRAEYFLHYQVRTLPYNSLQAVQQEKQAGKLRKNIKISVPKAREGGRTVGSGRTAT